MREIQIGTVIAANRKERGITQEELANHLGVSKPAVSKWESGQSYPDILLLPVMASYFNITVDQLIGYEPQMVKEDIRKLCHRLGKEFVKEPFDKVYNECEDYLRKYFSCWSLQFQIGILFLNHCALSGSPERINKIIERALEIFIRVEKSSEEVSLAKLSIQMQAVCYLSLQQPTAVIDLLEGQEETLMRPESILVKAYQMKGDNAKAIEYLQGYTYVNLMTMLGAAPDYFMMYADQPERMMHFYQIFTDLSELFEVEELHPAALLNIYLRAAMVFATQGNKTKAIEVLELYAGIIQRFEKETLFLHGNRIFDAIEGYFTTIDIETNAPRGMELILKDLRSTILNNPSFAELESEEGFRKIKRRFESK